MEKLILWRRLEGVLQTIAVTRSLCCVGQRAEHVSQTDHGLDHHPIVQVSELAYVCVMGFDKIHPGYTLLLEALYIN